ncbi:undecaprenyl-diphosphate phosphatase [Streptomyces mirabilis]|uniref:undecaprenyl-diphosphate phosphatase n=1 Tax=Streptomyces mirabilis TaxID=68239 RepID=UPI0036E84475
MTLPTGGSIALARVAVGAAAPTLFGLILAAADRLRAVRYAKPVSELTFPQALGYGFAQALALIPGVSRSGGTISAGLFMGYSREGAARYSFLLAIPAVLAPVSWNSSRSARRCPGS